MKTHLWFTPRKLVVYGIGFVCLMGVFVAKDEILAQISRLGCQMGIDALISSEKCYVDRAMEARRDGLNGQAISELNKAIERNPYDYQLYRERGINFVYDSRFDLAVSDFSIVIGLKPDDAGTYLLRGGSYLGEELYGPASSDAKRAIDVDRRVAFLGYAMQGDALIYENRYAQAISELSNAIILHPDGPSYSYYNRGLAYEAVGARDRANTDYARAVALLDKGIAQSPGDGLSYVQRGLVYERTGRNDLTIADETRALALHCLGPALAHIYRALAYDREGAHAKAVADLQAALRIDKFSKAEWDRIKRIEADAATHT